MTSPDYAPELARLRRSRSIVLWMWLAYLPLFGTIAMLPSWLGSDADFMNYAVFPYMAAWVIAALRLSRSQCPRCQERFFGRFPMSRFSSRCRYCDLSCAVPKAP